MYYKVYVRRIHRDRLFKIEVCTVGMVELSRLKCSHQSIVGGSFLCILVFFGEGHHLGKRGTCSVVLLESILSNCLLKKAHQALILGQFQCFFTCRKGFSISFQSVQSLGPAYRMSFLCVLCFAGFLHGGKGFQGLGVFLFFQKIDSGRILCAAVLAHGECLGVGNCTQVHKD